MKQLGWKKKPTDRVRAVILKKKLATDPEAQAVEDCACLEFLMNNLQEFAEDLSEKKLKDILKKTVAKMSTEAKACARGIRRTAALQTLLHEALDAKNE